MTKYAMMNNTCDFVGFKCFFGGFEEAQMNSFSIDFNAGLELVPEPADTFEASGIVGLQTPVHAVLGF